MNNTETRHDAAQLQASLTPGTVVRGTVTAKTLVLVGNRVAGE